MIVYFHTYKYEGWKTVKDLTLKSVVNPLHVPREGETIRQLDLFHVKLGETASNYHVDKIVWSPDLSEAHIFVTKR